MQTEVGRYIRTEVVSYIRTEIGRERCRQIDLVYGSYMVTERYVYKEIERVRKVGTKNRK